MKSFLPLLPFLTPSVAATATTACYSAPGQLVPSLHSALQSPSLCQHHCSKTNHSVAALHNGTACFCGSSADLPPETAKRALSECATPCPGYPADSCGGPTTWTVLISDLHRRVDPAAESVIVTAPETDADGARSDPLASLSVNPTVVQTGVPLPTGSAGAIDGYKTAPVPNEILTAPARTRGASTANTVSMGAAPTSTMTTTVSSAVVASASPTGSRTATASGSASPSASAAGAAGGLVVPGSGFVGVLSVLVALLC